MEGCDTARETVIVAALLLVRQEKGMGTTDVNQSTSPPFKPIFPYLNNFTLVRLKGSLTLLIAVVQRWF